MTPLNWLDLAFIGVIALSVLIGVIRGFVREVISVLVWVAAFWIGARYSAQVGEYLSPWLASSMLRLVAGFAGLFILTLLVGALISYTARVLVGRTGLTGTDRLLGVVFGALRGLLLTGAVVLGAGLTAIPGEAWWQESVIAQGYRPWVCHARVGSWLDQAQQMPGVARAPVNSAAAFAYWEAYCQINSEQNSDSGS
ncbi:CvpA family protein [Spiribacter vilamensis]|uniref:Membrane protein required for colicin V production n=1 Tax=Spiribacter vilamensis TaxID=531306 RepID=A0A4Q8CYD8_9GAMM|nr:CvpA family protein [Spiribacter vilamensis]RZU97991.1 membrane protein required for colicin V production [Spiribacter vilamensis]